MSHSQELPTDSPSPSTIARTLSVRTNAMPDPMNGLSSSPLMQALSPDSAEAVIRKNRRPRVVVVGAGAFGGWTALCLLRRGARVTLLDSWGPGNSRASSGGETRVIRGTYGPNRVYVKMAARSLQLWRESEARWKLKLFHPTGVLWMETADTQYERGSLPLLREAGCWRNGQRDGARRKVP